MERDQVWALRRDIERWFLRERENPRPQPDDRRPLGAHTIEEITERSLLRRTLAVLDEL